VAEVGESDIYGNYIRLRHGSTLETVYCHCSAILAWEGAIIRKGERVAEVGATGLVTGPHLHFEVRLEGDYVDPMVLYAP